MVEEVAPHGINTLTSIMQRIIAYPIESKSPMESIAFLSEIKRQLSALLNDAGSNGYYWSSSLRTDDPSEAFVLHFRDSYVKAQINGIRCYGKSVRAVRRK